MPKERVDALESFFKALLPCWSAVEGSEAVIWVYDLSERFVSYTNTFWTPEPKKTGFWPSEHEEHNLDMVYKLIYSFLSRHIS